ncbi:class I SAM-dependent methyltransferase [Streptomyces sp. Root369]|uniref:SAM-dependent methyltransferase n=1 Tax=Streptomyces sp. Root369 TaxID=1736523 RepID=UPI0007093004|nr:class I SAM-dependent methyltransferase [Streptomyces sp. Root369]KQV94231.1 hypothetical protein ASD08_14475 [Streptomyces sp. Root369]
MRQGGPALDIGCGRGRVALALAAAGLSVTALDTSYAATSRLSAHLAGLPELAARIEVLRQDVHDTPPVGGGYATAVLGDTSVNMFADGRALTGFLHRVRPLLAPDGVFCCAVVQETALSAYAGRSGVVATDFTDDRGRRQLLFAAVCFEPAGPYFSRTLFLPDGTREGGEPVAHLAAVREPLWTAGALTPHVHEAGFQVTERIAAVARNDGQGRVDTEILVLAPDT